MPTGTTKQKKEAKTVKKTVRIMVVLDESGSMLSRQDDTIDAVNNFLGEQAKETSTLALVSIMAFATKTRWLAKETSIVHVDRLELNRQNYRPDGWTALYDAVGKAAAEAQNSGSNDGIVVIVTDGGENASQEFKIDGVKDIIMQMEQRGWSFIFLGADVNAWTVGSAMGIGAHQGIATLSSAPYTPAQPSIAFAVASDSARRYRSSSAVMGLADTAAISLRAHNTALTPEEIARLNAAAAGTTTPPVAPINTTSTNTK